jgi:hypothetical protein
MMYSLDELLMKMGAPEAKEKGHMHWHYFDRMSGEIGGYAEVRLMDGGESLVAELRQQQNGQAEAESLFLHARRSGSRYSVTKIAFDGEEYAHPQKSVIELGLSIFHARALDISILMVEQAFNKQDVTRPIIDERSQLKDVPIRVKTSFQKEAWGIVVPFRPRHNGVVAANLF